MPKTIICRDQLSIFHPVAGQPSGGYWRGQIGKLSQDIFYSPEGKIDAVLKKQRQTGIVGPQTRFDAQMLEEPGHSNGRQLVLMQAMMALRQLNEGLANLRGRQPPLEASVQHHAARKPHGAGNHPWDWQPGSKEILADFVHMAELTIVALRTNNLVSGCVWQMMRASGVRITTRSNRPAGIDLFKSAPSASSC